MKRDTGLYTAERGSISVSTAVSARRVAAKREQLFCLMVIMHGGRKEEVACGSVGHGGGTPGGVFGTSLPFRTHLMVDLKCV